MMASMDDLSTWLTKPEAAAALGISVRSLERLDEKGQGPPRKDRPRRGKRPEPVYDPGWIAEFRASRQRPEVMPPLSPTHSPDLAPAMKHDNFPAFALLANEIAGLVKAWPMPPRPLPWFLSVEEAAEYSGLSKAYLRTLCRNGSLPSIRNRGFMISRHALDELAKRRDLL